MVSTYNLQEKFNQVKRNFRFYLDVHDRTIARTLSKRIEDLGLQREVFLTGRVTHLICDSNTPVTSSTARWVPRDGTRSRADAMLQRVRPDIESVRQTAVQTNYIILSVQKAIILLDKIYDTFFSAPRKTNVRVFKKHYIKIEFLDKLCRPVYKEFDEWPEINLEPDPPREKKVEDPKNNHDLRYFTASQRKMTRKNRPRLKEKEEREPKGGYCEMCNSDYIDAVLHRKSAQHLAFIRDPNNFVALDTLIDAGGDVKSFLEKTATPINGERRSLRKICNGDTDHTKSKCCKRSQSPDSPLNGNHSPKQNGTLEDDKKHNTRCSKRISESQLSDDRQYYKVVGVSTKLRSSGGFVTKKKETPPTCNGAKPLVVKFRKIRKSEVSVLSDEAEQFMFPKRASSTSSVSSDDDDEDEKVTKNPPRPSPTLERRRLARPLALKEESSEEDSWPEDNRRKKRKLPPVVKRTRRTFSKQNTSEKPVEEEDKPPPSPPPLEEPKIEEKKDPPKVEDPSPLRQENIEKCMKWEDGKLKYTPAVEQLEFAFETVPQSEPWFETFKRQDEDKLAVKNVPHYFSLYSTKSPKLPYEVGQLPPLKPNCCPLSDMVKRDEKPGPSRLYGTRGMKKERIRKRTTAALLALEGHPRKSPREHASTLAILGSAGLLHRRRLADDTKSTASEDTISETQSNANTKFEPVLSETQEASERLQQFLSEVFEEAVEYDLCNETVEGDTAVTTWTNVPDVLSLMSECEGCDIIRDEIRQGAALVKPRGRRGKFKKKNRTGWPNKRKQVKKSDSGPNSPENRDENSIDGSSIEPPDDETTQDSISEVDEPTLVETDMKDDIPLNQLQSSEDDSQHSNSAMDIDETITADGEDSDDKPLKLNVKVLLQSEDKKREVKDECEEKAQSSLSESEEKEDKGKVRKKRSVQAIAEWLQPVVRVARVDSNVSRRLRSAGRGRSSRFR